MKIFFLKRCQKAMRFDISVASPIRAIWVDKVAHFIFANVFSILQ